MRKNKLLATLLCSTLTMSSVLGGTGLVVVRAAETTQTITSTTEGNINNDMESQYEQLTMPIVSITTDENQAITSKEEYVNAQIDVVDDTLYNRGFF